MSVLKPFFWISFSAAAAVYAAMLFWTLPAISAAAGGAAPFDLRPLGYSVGEAQAFLAALTDQGRQIYLDVQQRLDIAYPALLAIVLGLGSALIFPPRFGNRKWLSALTPAAGMLFDYRENALVRRMLNSPPDALNPDLVAAASNATMLKSVFTFISMSALLVLCVLWLRRRRDGPLSGTNT
jgi:hypothetical protein